jgi:hypothetical protein
MRFYLIEKSIGTLNQTGTGFPPCFPGLNVGSVLTTLLFSALQHPKIFITKKS